MARKIKNICISSTDQDYLVMLQEEYTVYGNFLTELEPGHLIVLSKRAGTKPKRKKGQRPERNKRAESAARHA